MATLKYQQPSPYKVSSSGPPPEDTKYIKYLEGFRPTSSSIAPRFGFALFGIGRAGTIHLSFLATHPQIDLLYIVEDDTSKWDKLRNYWNLRSTTFLISADAGTVYKDPKVHAVVVASPTYTHEDIVMNALDGRIAVFCEKPLAGTYEQTKACYDKAKKLKVPLLSAFNRRFDPSFAAIKERVRNGEVGKVLTVKVCSRDSPLPTIEYLSVSGRIFHDCAVHDIDMTINMLGEYPSKVMVMAKANIPEIAEINDFDTVGIMMSFDSGAIGIIDLSRHSSYGYDQRVEVFGEKGMLKAENQQPVHNLESYTKNGVRKAPIAYSFPSRYSDGYNLELLHFLDVLEGKRDLCIDSRDTLAVTRIASACEESVETGNAVQIIWSKEELLETQVSAK